MTDTHRILLVEDDPAIAALMTDMLEQASYEVDGPYSTLAEGVEAVAERMPAGAVLDVHLRGSDVDLLAGDLDNYAIPYVLCSGADAHQMKDAHPTASFILKPNMGTQLVAELHRLLH
jgi:DNA-binding response OmpR family regulator